MDKNGPPPPGFVPPPPYTPHQQQTPPVVVVQTSPVLGPEPQRMVCPHCRADILTKVDTESTARTHLFALLLCVLGLWPCAPCPYCMDSCLVKKHYCPNCKNYLGEYDN